MQRGRRLTTNQKIACARQVCALYATTPETLLACLKQAGVDSEQTWANWQKIAAIAGLYKKAQSDRQAARICEKARHGWELLLEARTVREEEIISCAGVLRRIVRTRWLEPDLRAVIFALQVFDAETFNPQGQRVTPPRIVTRGGPLAPFA